MKPISYPTCCRQSNDKMVSFIFQCSEVNCSANKHQTSLTGSLGWLLLGTWLLSMKKIYQVPYICIVRWPKLQYYCNLRISHVGPVKHGGHEHWNPGHWFWQIPPFLHGSEPQ